MHSTNKDDNEKYSLISLCKTVAINLKTYARIISFIGKKFYDLAAKYNKHQWGFAIAGVASYYMGTFIAGILIAIYLELWGSTSIDDINDLALNFMALPFGVLACFGLYKLLERSWERKPTQLDSDILDEQLPK